MNRKIFNNVVSMTAALIVSNIYLLFGGLMHGGKITFGSGARNDFFRAFLVGAMCLFFLVLSIVRPPSLPRLSRGGFKRVGTDLLLAAAIGYAASVVAYVALIIYIKRPITWNVDGDAVLWAAGLLAARLYWVAGVVTIIFYDTIGNLLAKGTVDR